MIGCLECGRVHAPTRTERDADVVEIAGQRTADFCSAACRHAWNNRRRIRGAELYDLYMAARYERPLTAKLKVWGWIARLAASYRDEDRDQRDGRKSWRHPSEIAARRPWIAGRILQRRRAA